MQNNSGKYYRNELGCLNGISGMEQWNNLNSGMEYWSRQNFRIRLVVEYTHVATILVTMPISQLC